MKITEITPVKNAEKNRMNEQRKLVFDILNNLKIKYEALEHPEVKTMEEMNALGLDANNEIAKNLFLCDKKKKRFFIISISKNKAANLKELKNKLSAKSLSFASEEQLNTVLGLKKGQVTPLGILNDKEHRVEVIFDEDIRLFKRVGVHPNDNTATVFVSPADLEKIIVEHGNLFSYINMDAQSAATARNE